MEIRSIEPIGVEVLGLDLATASEKDILAVPEILSEHLVVVIRGHDHLSLDRFAEINKMWGRHEHTELWCRHQENSLVMRVTNKEIKDGRQGLFPSGEMQWHPNGPLMPDPEQALVLWCVEPGEGSITSFLDTARAYDEMSEEMKVFIEEASIILTNRVGQTILKKAVCDVMDQESLKELEAHRTRQNNKSREAESNIFVKKKMVVEHPKTRRRGLYFPYFYINDIEGLKGSDVSTTFEAVVRHLNRQDRFVYHHRWEKGDMVLSDQIFTQHKRSAHQGERELYRTVFWYPQAGNVVN